MSAPSKKPVKAPPKAVADYLFSAGATISGVQHQQHEYHDDEEETNALKLKRKEEDDDGHEDTVMGSTVDNYRPKDKKDEGDGIFLRSTNYLFNRRGGGRKYTPPGLKILVMLGALIIVLLTFVISAMTSGLRGSSIRHSQLSPPTKGAVLPENLPASCTEDQKKKVREQLDINTCPHGSDATKNPNCGITVATAKGGQRGHTWLEQYLIEAGDEHGKIQAVFVDCQTDWGINAVGTLRLGSHESKFDMEKWAQEYDSSKKHQILAQVYWDPSRINTEAYDGTHEGTKVYCLASDEDTVSQMRKTVDSLGWKDRLIPQYYNYNGTHLDDHVHKSTSILSEDGAAIQYLHLGSRGFDSRIMAGASKVLDRVEYLSFSYASSGAWKKQSFEEAIDHLKYKGFACYFDGYESYLWRITECYQPYFGMGQWSRIACVNTNLESTTNLRSIMESVFLGTLTKSDIQYGS